MARFSAAVKPIQPDTTNLAGGEAFSESPKLEFASILLTSFMTNKTYETSDVTMQRLLKLLPVVGYEFAAKAALYARNEAGMRTVTHVVGGEIAKHVKGAEWTKKFFLRLFHRPDDMAEVLAYYISKYGKRPIPHSLKKSIREKLEGMSAHALAKYKMESRSVKMVDLVNLTRPRPGKSKLPAGEGPIGKLITGKLESANTWETKITAAAQKAETQEEKIELKQAAWSELLKDNALGYLALLRNLRNLSELKESDIDVVCQKLLDEEQIRKHLIMPHQILTAIKVVEKERKHKKIHSTLLQVLDLSCQNIELMTDGDTLVAVDCSGSMDTPVNNSALMHSGQDMTAKPTCKEAAGIFGAALAKRGADVIAFSTTAVYANIRQGDSVISIAETILRSNAGGTDFKPIFDKAHKKYRRIIILSDMQAWVGSGPKQALKLYRVRHKANPMVFCWDLQGYGTLQFPEANVYALAGFSDQNFKLLKQLEEDRQALVNKIETITL